MLEYVFLFGYNFPLRTDEEPVNLISQCTWKNLKHLKSYLSYLYKIGYFAKLCTFFYMNMHIKSFIDSKPFCNVASFTTHV